MHTNRFVVAVLVLALPLTATAQAPTAPTPLAGQAPAVSQTPPTQQPPPSRTVTLPENAPSVDLFALIDRLADEMDKEFIIDPQVARVPGLSTAGADADYDTLLALLRNAQYAAIESGDQIRIVPEVTARSEPTPIVNEDDSRISDHAVVTRIIDVSGIEVNLPGVAPEEAGSIGPQLVPVLRPLMSTAIGNMAIVTGTNKVILTDRYDNIRRITAIIDALR